MVSTMDAPTARVYRAEVCQKTVLSPGMMRVVLGGSDLAGYPTTGSPDEYVRLFFPDVPGEEPRIPWAVGRGWEFAAGVDPAPMRTYTVRAHSAGVVTIDFVRHAGGLAAEWAEQVRPGDAIGISLPFAQSVLDPAARRITLVADATALPAVERIIEQARPDTEIRLFCEVADASDARLPAAAAERIVRANWLYESGNGAYASRVADVCVRAELAADGSETVWVAGESAMTRRVRSHLRKTLGFPAAHTHLVGYWTDNERAWNERHDALGGEVRAQLDHLYSAYREVDGTAREAVLDEIYTLYDRAEL